MFMIFSSVVPVFIVILAGVIVERLHILPENTGDILTRFCMGAACPCLIFHIMSTAPVDQLSQGAWWAGVLGLQFALFYILYGIERLRKKETGPAVVASLAANFCNSGFVGMSVIMNIMPGNQSALTAAGVFMVACNGIFIAGQMMVIGWSRVKRMGNHHLHVSVPLYKRVWRFLEHFILSNAFLMATLLGLLVSVSGVPVWAPLDKGIAMLGYTAPATMIFTLGLCLRPNLVAALRAHSISVPQQIWLCSFRLVIVPALTLGVLLLLGVDPLWTCVTVVISATGTGIIVSALAQLYNAIPGPAALTIGLTNILSLFSITGTLYFLHATGLMPAGVAF